MRTQSYKSNRHMVYACKDPVVFCPKYRRKVLVDGLDVRWKEIIQQVADELECEIMSDPVPILGEVDPQCGVHKWVKRVKGLSSFLLCQPFPALKSRLPTLWTHSDCRSSVGGAPLAVIQPSIENQKDG
jgi:putative transposase